MDGIALRRLDGGWQTKMGEGGRQGQKAGMSNFTVQKVAGSCDSSVSNQNSS